MSSRKMSRKHCTWGNSRQQGPLAKKAKLDEVLATLCRADLVTECMKRKKYYQVTFVFIFRTKMNVHFRFRFVFGRKWNFIFVDIFVYDRKWKMSFGRPLVYITKRSWSWSWYAIVACRFLLGFGRLISYHRNIFAGRTSIITRPGVAGEAAE